MDKRILMTVAMTVLIAAVGLVAAQASAASKASTSADGKVVCSGYIADGKVADFIAEQLAAGRTNIQMAAPSAALVCAW